ncbi:MAG TPA: Zn-ribbon domain-containing OB-fold protein [Acidobacteria bacterium]|nr:Zn-ribbon domain-containing OB-fold protein [Acidobacteriota bacterium]
MQSPARAWREYPQRYRLEAARCTSCGTISYPPRVVCPGCRGTSFETVALSRKGTVVTFTVVHVPPAGFEGQAPLILALVELEDGVRTMVQIADVADPSEVKIGMPVRLEFRKISEEGEAGTINYGHKAVPA